MILIIQLYIHVYKIYNVNIIVYSSVTSQHGYLILIQKSHRHITNYELCMCNHFALKASFM